MAIEGFGGAKISFDSEDLIRELEQDLAEFGDIKVAAYYELYNDAKVYTDYQFIEDKDKFEGNTDIVQASFLLKYFKKQNSII